MFLLQDSATAEQTVKKSRFIATAAPVDSEEAARAFIAARSDPAARHNCWAWRIGQAYRFNDDGEPGGTAGKPILQAIDGQEVDRVAVIVTRWFGGILLGTGGLVRAYGGTAALCLREAPKVEAFTTKEIGLKVLFTDLALVRARLLAIEGAVILSETFGEEGANLVATLPEATADAMVSRLKDLTSGRLHLVEPEKS